MSEASPLFGPLFLVGFAAWWCLISFMIAALGGWRRLAKEYATQQIPYGQSFLWSYGRFGLSYYSGCLNIWSSPAGIFLSVSLMFRPGHPRLFIPRSAIRVLGVRKMLFLEQVELEITSADGPVIVRLPKAVADAASLDILQAS